MRCREVAQHCAAAPGVEPIRIIQDKTLQKTWLAENGFPVGPFRVVRSEAELHEAVAALGGRVFLKIGRGGYDGRGQARIGFDAPATEESIAAAWREHRRAARGGRAGARSGLRDQRDGGAQSVGEVRSFPAARNHHENQILAWSVLPAGVPAELEARAEALAAAIIAQARYGRSALRGDLCHARRASCW